MDCTAVSNWLSRQVCHLNNSSVDEMVGLAFLIFIAVGGMAILVKAFIDGIKPQSPGTPDSLGQSDGNARGE